MLKHSNSGFLDIHFQEKHKIGPAKIRDKSWNFENEVWLLVVSAKKKRYVRNFASNW